MTIDDKLDLVEAMSQDILAGRFRPGEWLRQIDVEERYGVNRFDVRTALTTLASRKIVEHVTNRGYRVVSPTVQQRAELTAVREMVEVPAARLVATVATPASLAPVRDIAERFDAAVETRPATELLALNHRFHRAFYALCGNTILSDLINDLRERTLPGNWGSWSTVGNIRASSIDHLDLMAAVEGGDPEAAGALVTRHLWRWRGAADG
jgi:DNA-binding GntR family transcriptional regulator